ncbi:hypothetical protein DYB37_000595 [Aphanomyces astaci]|uniref:Uncharacterized protein n=1 Tax=Aphanomyces astaci TaxID=112090 RepID=A0A3R6YCC9_APHAT|nr:hypothetical protein DYB35_003860 [Aphanomyces astaci]RHZ09533.1 hypothetical protein DYB37_000595 [Aphanomyces astaci]
MLEDYTDCSIPGATCSPTCLAVFNDALGVNSSNASDWRRSCDSHHTITWRCCGQQRLDIALPLTLWAIFFVLAGVFSWYTSLRRELLTSVDDLHDIPTQALGVVVARQKKQVLGRTVNDPRRSLILLSMVIELGNFSFLPLNLVFDVPNASHLQLTGLYLVLQLGKLGGFTTLLLLDLYGHHAFKGAMKKVFRPLLYDTFFTTYVYVLLDFGACANGMESLPWLDCSREDRFWLTYSVAVVAFTTVLWRTLLYKKHLSDQVYAVQFRFQQSYYSLMTYCRTACCLMFITVQKLYLYFDGYNIMLTASVANFGLFSLLLWYNYSHQPCLGVGMLPNNLRSLSFATSCYFSIHLLVLSIHHKLHAPLQLHHDDDVTTIVNYVFIGVYPCFGCAVWHVNKLRAQLFQIPNLSIEASLMHTRDRVRAVGAVAMTLEDQTEWTVDYKLHLVNLLKANLSLTTGEGGMVAAYTSRSIWLLWAKNFTLANVTTEGDDASFSFPFGLFESTPASSITGPTSMGIKANRANRANSAIPATILEHIQTIKSGCGPTLAALVNSTMHPLSPHDDHKLCSVDSDLVAACRKAIVVMSDVVRCPYPKARQVVCRTIHHMYTNRAVQFTPPTMVYVLCTLLACDDHMLALSAATTLASHFKTHMVRAYATAATDVADEFNLLHLSQFVRMHAKDTALVDSLLRIILDAISWIESAPENPASYIGDGFVSNLWRVQSLADVQPSTVFLVDNILLNVHFCCENFLVHLRRSFSHQPTKRNFSLQRPSILPETTTTVGVVPPSLSFIRVSKMSSLISQTSVQPAANSFTRSRTKFSLDMTTKFLVETHSSNLIRPVQYQIMKKRHDLKKSLQINIATVVQDGFPQQKAIVELSDQSKRAMRQVMRIVTRFPIFDAWLRTLQEGDPLEYLLELIEFMRTHPLEVRQFSEGPSVMESIRSTFSIKRSARESVRAPPR